MPLTDNERVDLLDMLHGSRVDPDARGLEGMITELTKFRDQIRSLIGKCRVQEDGSIHDDYLVVGLHLRMTDEEAKEATDNIKSRIGIVCGDIQDLIRGKG